MLKPYRNILFAIVTVAVSSFALGYAARQFSARHPGAHRLWFASLTDGRGLSSDPSRTFALVLEDVRDSYVDRITDEAPLAHGALRGMVDELDDPNSRFLDAEETRSLLDAADGLFHGVGAIVHIETSRTNEGERRRAVVVNVLPGGPAAAAGLRVGDVIVKINEKWLYEPRLNLKVAPRGEAVTDASPTEPAIRDDAEMDDFLLYQTRDIMRPLSEDGQTLRLLVLGPGGNSLERLIVVTAPLSVRAPRAAAITETKPTGGRGQPQRVAEIRIPAFTRTTGPDLDAALADARRARADRVVLDLRGCVGGRVERAVQVASRFVDGSVGTVERRQAGRSVRVPLTARRTENAWTGPLAVLVDRSTLGSAELLAGALAARNRAILVGVRTFGDGSEQSVIPLGDGSSLLLTTGKYFAPDGLSFQAKGVSPGAAAITSTDPAALARDLLARRG